MKPRRGTPPTLTEVLGVAATAAGEPPLPPTTESMPLEFTAPGAIARPDRPNEVPTLLDAQIEARVRAAVAALMPAWQEALVRAVVAAVSAELRAKPPPPIG